MGPRLEKAGWRVPAALLLWVIGLYAASLGTGFHYDDSHSLVDNPSVRQLSNLGRFFVDPGAFSALPEARMYRPLVLVSYAVNHALGDDDAVGYHVVNVLVHALNACLVWWLARRWLGPTWAALGAALCFATHPVLSEPVEYVSSRSESMAAAFVLAGALAVSRVGEAGWRRRLGLTAATAGAVLCKATGIVLLPLSAWLLWLRHHTLRAVLPALAGPAAVAAAYVLGTRAIVDRALVAAPVRGWAAQAGTQLAALPFYLHTCLMPVRLSVEPQFSPAGGVLAAGPLLALALVISLIAVLLGATSRPDPVRPDPVRAGATAPLLRFGAGWVAVALAPTSIVPLHILVNEHRLYLPMVGGALLGGLLLRAAGARGRRAGLVLLGLWALLVLQRHAAWRTEETLWADAVRKGPAMARPHVNLGKALLEQGRYDEAIAASRAGLAIDPRLARAHYNIGTARLQQGRDEEAIASYARALEIEPTLVEALNNLGNAYQNQGLHGRAIAAYRRALEVVDAASIQHNLAGAFLAAGQADSAIAHFQRALREGGEAREVQEGLARAQRRAGRLGDAVETLRRALATAPGDAELLELLGAVDAEAERDDEALAAYRRAGLDEATAHRRVAAVARQRGQWARARQHLEAGLRTAPGDADLVNALGTVELAAGDAATALQTFRRAAQLDPSLADAFGNIGLVYLRNGRPVEALAALERARDLTDTVAAEGSEARERAGRTWELLARVQAMRGDTTAAVAAYDKAIELLPQRAESYHNLGALREAGGQLRQAERLYRQALARDPELTQARYNLGYVLLELGRPTEAAATLEALLARDPDDAAAYVNLASARLALGDTAAAARAYERFLQLHPAADDTRRRIEGQLRQLRSSPAPSGTRPH